MTKQAPQQVSPRMARSASGAEGELSWPGVILFSLTLVAGLFYVKWSPYYAKAFIAASRHALGGSILMGKTGAPPAASWHAATGFFIAYGKSIWKALVLGLLLGSGVQALIPPRWVARSLGRPGFSGVLAGGLMALPGMMCTCCSAPIVAGLRARKASSGGAMAFWLGNPVLNPATLVFIGFVLGWQWTALRLGLGTLMVFGLGYAASRLDGPAERSRVAFAEAAAAARAIPMFRRWLLILGNMTLRLVPEYAILVLLLGAGRAWLFPHVGPEIDNGLLWICAFALAGTVFVIPTAGEVPIIQAMLSLGMAAAPAAALLLTLPAVSLPSAAMLAKSFPPRILALACATVFAFGILAGCLALVFRF